MSRAAWVLPAVLALLTFVAGATLAWVATRGHVRADANRAERREEILDERELRLRDQEARLHARDLEAIRELERIAGMSTAKALRRLEDEAASSLRERIQEAAEAGERQAQLVADHQAQMIIGGALARVAIAPELITFTQSIPLPEDRPDMAARIIGKNGLNVRAFARVTGVDINIYNPQRQIVLTDFDPYRRHLAIRTIERLFASEKITPSSIEEEYGAVLAAADQDLHDIGLSAAATIGVIGLSDALLRTLGKLRFQVVGSRDVLRTSILRAGVADVLARELKFDAATVRRAALLCDVGFCESLESPGDHAAAGADAAEAAGEPPEVCRAIRYHHQIVWPPSGDRDATAGLVAMAEILVATASATVDAPGELLRRLRRVERLCTDIPGVAEAVVLRMGREVRILVHPDEVPEAGLQLFAHRVAERLRTEYDEPVSVTALRESIAVA